MLHCSWLWFLRKSVGCWRWSPVTLFLLPSVNILPTVLAKCIVIVSWNKICYSVTIYFMNDGLKGLVGVIVV